MNLGQALQCWNLLLIMVFRFISNFLLKRLCFPQSSKQKQKTSKNQRKQLHLMQSHYLQFHWMNLWLTIISLQPQLHYRRNNNYAQLYQWNSQLLNYDFLFFFFLIDTVSVTSQWLQFVVLETTQISISLIKFIIVMCILLEIDCIQPQCVSYYA